MKTFEELEVGSPIYIIDLTKDDIKICERTIFEIGDRYDTQKHIAINPICRTFGPSCEYEDEDLEEIEFTVFNTSYGQLVPKDPWDDWGNNAVATSEKEVFDIAAQYFKDKVDEASDLLRSAKLEYDKYVNYEG